LKDEIAVTLPGLSLHWQETLVEGRGHGTASRFSKNKSNDESKICNRKTRKNETTRACDKQPLRVLSEISWAQEGTETDEELIC
jgi:hypothetical protein